MPKILRPYQQACHEAIVNEYNMGVIKQLIVLFTGAGKTFLLIKLLERMGFKRVLWLSFQTELVEQSGTAFVADKFEANHYEYVKTVGFLEAIRNGWVGNEEFKIGCIKADVFKIDANVVMGSVMTVAKRLDKLDSDYFDCIVCDEAHLFASQQAFNVLNHFTPKLLIGCTATPHREDNMLLGDIFDKITFEYGLDRGIKDGYSAELDAIRIKTTTSLDNVKTLAGEFNQKELSQEIDTLARNQLIAESYLKYCKGRSVIAFCSNIEHSIHLAEQMRLNGIKSVAVSSDEELTPNRSENIRAFKNGEIDVITNVNIMVAGFDYPDTGGVIMASPTKSLTKYLQAVGRSARLKSDDYAKKFGQKAIILDIVDATNRHNLINAWELDRRKPLDERVFISSEKRQLLEAERNKKSLLTHIQDKDELVSLLSLPIIKLKKNIKMDNSEVSSAHLAQIAKWGYDVKNTHYTKEMVKEIYLNRPAEQKIINLLKTKGYDVSSGVTVGQAQLILQTIKK